MDPYKSPLDDDYDNPSGLSLNARAREHLGSAAKWGRFLSIISFIAIGLMVFGLIASFFLIGTSSGTDGLGPLAGLGGMYVLMMMGLAVFYFIPTLYLYRFASNGRKAVETGDNTALLDSLANMSSLLKFYGILVAIFLGFYALIIIAGIVGGSLSSLF